MKLIDADALSAFVGDLRSTLHKEQSKFKCMTDIEFSTRDYMLLNFQYAIDNAPTVEYPEQITVECDTEEDKQKLLSALRNVKLKAIIEDERPKGEWIITGEEQGAVGITYKIRKCNKCGWEHSLVIPNNFCPNCGADMRGEENE